MIGRRPMQAIAMAKERDEEAGIDQRADHLRPERMRSLRSRFECLATSSDGCSSEGASTRSFITSYGVFSPLLPDRKRSSASFTASLLLTPLRAQYSASSCSTRRGIRTDSVMVERV